MKKVFEALERIKTAPGFMGGTKKYMNTADSAGELTKDYNFIKKIFEKIESKVKYNQDEMIFNINIGPDDFESSEEWNEFKEVMLK